MYHTEVAGHSLVVVTSRAGANRVYEAGSTRFARRLDDDRVADDAGRIWTVAEDALIPQDEAAQRLPRVPAQRAFWFGWYAQFPDTVLIQRSPIPPPAEGRRSRPRAIGFPASWPSNLCDVSAPLSGDSFR